METTQGWRRMARAGLLVERMYGGECCRGGAVWCADDHQSRLEKIAHDGGTEGHAAAQGSSRGKGPSCNKN